MKLTDNMVNWLLVSLVIYLFISFTWMFYKGHTSYFPRLAATEIRNAKMLADAAVKVNNEIMEGTRVLLGIIEDCKKTCRCE